MKRIRKGGTEGLTLVEVMVALSVFTMFIGGACHLLVRGRQMTDAARDHYTAINIVKNRLEKARTFDWDHLGTFNETNVVVNEVGVSDPQGSYQRTTTVTYVKDNLAKVSLSIKIRDRNTGAFGSEEECVSSYVASYWIRPEEE